MYPIVGVILTYSLEKALLFEFWSTPSLLWISYRIFSTILQYFRGNRDRNTIVYNSIIPSIRARFLRIHPWSWHGHVSMRVEVFGCSLGRSLVHVVVNKLSLN